MGGRAEGLACADPGARTPIGASGNLPYITKMTVDENRKLALTNFNQFRNGGKVIESDHNVEILEVNLQFSHLKPERMEIFQFKNRNSQLEFKQLTTNTTDFSNCFKN